MRTSLFHHLWQQLPRNFRREALFQGMASIAPRPAFGVRPTEPIVVAGAFRTASGLGASARLCHDALVEAGLPVYGVDLTDGQMQPRDFTGFAFANGSNIDGAGTLILHVNSPLVPLALWRLGGRVVREKYVIGYWAWELPEVPAEWRHGVPFVHEIWVPSAFSAEAIRPIANGRPVRILPHPVALNGGTSTVLTDEAVARPFTVITIFNMASSFARKNPLAAITAFRKAFGDDPSCRLIVKTSNGSSFPEGISTIKNAIGSAHNVVLIEKSMAADEIEQLYRDSDVFISLHRSEGFGLALAEAMLHGLPVVATNWSGNVDFLTRGNGLPVPYRLISAADQQGTYHHPGMRWADADIGAAADALRDLRREPELARHLGKAGATYAARVWSAEIYTGNVRRYLGI